MITTSGFASFFSSLPPKKLDILLPSSVTINHMSLYSYTIPLCTTYTYLYKIIIARKNCIVLANILANVDCSSLSISSGIFSKTDST